MSEANTNETINKLSDLMSVAEKSAEIESINTEVSSEEVKPAEDSKPSENIETPTQEIEIAKEIESYEPNLTYKVHDKEFTFDERVSKSIKSKEDEDFFRDLYTKAAGVDIIKPKLEKERSEKSEIQARYNELNEKSTQLNNQFDYLNTILVGAQKGDIKSLDSLLDVLGVSDQILGSRLADRLSMSPEQREYAARQKEIEKKQYETVRQHNNLSEKERALEEKYIEIEQRQAEMELRSAISSSSSDILEVINKIDSSFGQDSFMKEVINVGVALTEEAIRRKQPEPEMQEVISMVAERYKKLIGVPSQPASSPKVASPVAAGMPVKTKVVSNPTKGIPQIGSGSGDSPIGPAVKKLSDLLKVN